MIEKNKSLILKEESIFSKIKGIFKKIFNIIFSTKCDKDTDNKDVTNITTEKSMDYLEPSEDVQILKDINQVDNNSSNIACKNDVFKKYNYVHDLNHTEQKKKIFELYKDIKEGRKDFDDLSAMELIQITKLFREEISLLEKKVM